MNFFELFLTVILVSFSGVMSPGPLFFANIIKGTELGVKSGLRVSIGHTFVEFPLVILLSLGFLTFIDQTFMRLIIGVVGGIVLLVFGAIQIKDAFLKRKAIYGLGNKSSLSPLLIGIVLTALNPLFIVWWLTTGMKLVVEALLYASLFGVLVMYASHIWLDYFWLSITAHLANKGKNLINTKGYSILLIIFGAILIYFGFNFILTSIWV